MVRVDGYVDGAHALHRQQRGEQRPVTRQGHGRRGLLPHAVGHQPLGQFAHGGVKFRVREVAVGVMQGHAMGRPGDLLGERVGHAQGGGGGGGGGGSRRRGVHREVHDAEPRVVDHLLQYA